MNKRRASSCSMPEFHVKRLQRDHPDPTAIPLSSLADAFRQSKGMLGIMEWPSNVWQLSAIQLVNGASVFNDRFPPFADTCLQIKRGCRASAPLGL